MALNAKNAETQAGKPIPVIEDGTYAARLIRVVDLGVQQNPFDKEKRANEIIITFELMDEFLLDEDGNEDPEKPRVMSDFVKLYRGADKGKNVNFLRALDPTNQYDGDWGALQAAQAPCLLNIIVKNKDSGDKNQIDSISPPMKGMSFRDTIVPGYVFDLDNPDREVYDEFPDWIKEKINTRIRGDAAEPTTYENTESQAIETQAAEPEVSDNKDDDVPW